MNGSIRARLSVMMFLQYVIWGAWLPLLGLYMGSYLNFDGTQKAWVFNAFAIASLTAIFFGGQLADRFFSQEKFLALCHLIGGLAMLGLAYQTSFWPFMGLMLLHCFFYVPTLSVTNAIAFANLKDAQKDFGLIRLWGTIGWIAASWPFIFIPIDWTKVPTMEAAGGVGPWLTKALSTLKEGKAMEAALTSTFIVAAVASFALAAFSLTLPRTAPAKKTDRDLSGEFDDDWFAPLKAIRLLAVPAILILFIVTFFDSLVHYCYFFWTSTFLAKLGMKENLIAPAMSIGQFAEIPAMALLGLFLQKLGWRKTMILGILGQAVRFGIYSFGTPELLWLVVASNLVHGFAYACFFATVYIYVDKTFPPDIRTSAQSLFNLLILGVGPFLGNFLWGWLGDFFSSNATGLPADKIVDFQKLFLVPMGFAIFAAIILAVFFHPREKEAASSSVTEL